jgi:signal transduction histidine kinase
MRAKGLGVWPFSAERTRRSEHRLALTVAAAFVGAGVCWVLLTDALLYRLRLDPILVARIETAKGWAFVALAGALVYAVTVRSASWLTRAQAVTSAVVESIADGVLLLGRDRTIVHANPAALRMLGCDRLDDLVGMGAVEFTRRFRLTYPDGSVVPPERLVSQRVFEEGGPLAYKTVMHPPGLPELVISAIAAAVRDEAGEPAELVVSVMHDITHSEHLERLRDQFFAGAAHSLKTPVAVIKANAQLLGRSATPALRRSTAAIDRQCGRIDRLVQNLLVLARHRSRTLQLHPAEVELGPVVEQAVREMATASVEHEVRSEIASSPRIYADQESLVMAFRNLIDEALRTSIAGAPVTVLVRSGGAADAEIGVRYRPLPPEERTVQEYGESDDLGVSRCVSQMIVQAHGGALREEPAGPETTAWVRLPASQADALH